MEPAGIVDCFSDLQQGGCEGLVIILDNDAINGAGFYPYIKRDRYHTVKI